MIYIYITNHKVHRCLARYRPPATTIKKPINKWAGKAWPKMTKNAIFGQICVVLRQRILIFTGESKSLGAHITKNHLGTFLYDILARHWTKCQCLAQNEQKCHYWAKFGRFWAKNPYSFGRKQKFWYPRKGKRHLEGNNKSAIPKVSAWKFLK